MAPVSVRFDTSAPRWAFLLTSIVLVAFIGWIDYATGTELSFSIFYVLPTALAAWRLGLVAGVAISLMSSTVWLVADSLGNHPYSHPALPYWNAAVRLAFFVIIALAVAKLGQAHEGEKQWARTDSLTGLANGRFFRELLALELSRSHRYGRPVSLAYIDLDNFKVVNDTKGHAAGDAMLQRVGHALSHHSRLTDVAGRIGGDEFVLLLPETDSQVAFAVLDRMTRKLLETLGDEDDRVTVSVGLVTYRAVSSNVEAALSQADARMYAAKAAGKNRIVQLVVD